MQNNNMGFNQNRNFSNPAMSQGGGFGGPGGGIGGGGFNAGGMGMGGFNNNFNRGGMMGGMNRGGGMMNRGGRGGMMGTMGMGGMGMGANMMGGGMMGGMGAMGMGGPMAGMGMGGRHSTFFGRDRFHRNRVDAYVSIPAGGFGGPQQPHFNPAFFNQGGQGNMGAGGDWGNHPNKRQRQE